MFSRTRIGFGALLLLGLAHVPGLAQPGRPSHVEPAGGISGKRPAYAERHLVAAAHPLAVAAGLKMLESGGNAIDATIATQLVLNLVEPQSSGLGGGAFMLVYEARRGALRAYDGRETAPRAVTPELFLKHDGTPMAFQDAVVGGRSVGVPGVARLMQFVHARYGKLEWATLFQPAIELAENGFALTPRLHRFLRMDRFLAQNATAREVFFAEEGTPKSVGARVTNPEFARTLRILAARGADAFYTGEVARDIVAAVRGHPSNPGAMTEADLAEYRARELEPVCAPYRTYRVCGMPPPSSGGIAVLQMLGILSHFDMPRVRPGSSEAVHLVSEAGRLAYADRGRYAADDRFKPVPVRGLIDPAYLAERARLIRPEKSLGRAEAGLPSGAEVAYAADAADRSRGTSHISVVDDTGNAVAMTTSIEYFFGSRIMVRGFVLNNTLTDFNFVPVEGGGPVANAVEPGKRPRSSMSPTVVFDEAGRVHLLAGSAGGSAIINHVAKVLVATLDWKLDIQAAIDFPNFGSRNGPTEIERGTSLEQLIAPLRGVGHEVRVMDMTSGLHGIMRRGSGWLGGADPRREGVARGK
jgi:gamma-glutamyltranspeptidase/glutathione hydrolase